MRKSQAEIIEMLRNPAKYRAEHPQKQNTDQREKAVIDSAQKLKEQKRFFILLVGILVLLGISFLAYLHGKNKADNASENLDPSRLSGLQINTEFNPNKEVHIVQIQEGHDRNYAAANLGSTLPIISRFNFKTFTDANYAIIGAAPWALSLNIDSNDADPQLVNYLLSNKAMINAFIDRKDIRILLDSPKDLTLFLKDEDMLKAFLDNGVVQKVIASEPLTNAIINSSLMVAILNSKTGKYFRKNPQEALSIILASPSLKTIQQNANVRKVIGNSSYFKAIAPTILSVNPIK